MTTPVAQIVDAAAYAQAVEDAVQAATAYYEGGTSSLDDDASWVQEADVLLVNGGDAVPVPLDAAVRTG